MTTESQEIGLITLTSLLVTAMITRMDKIVHCDLYRFGLQFDYAWAEPYWQTLWLINIAIPLQNIAVYWFRRKENLRNLLTALLTGLSHYLLSANLDLIWFGYVGGLPPLNEVWWWMPQYKDWGIQWTTLHQIGWTAAWNIIYLTMWIVWWMKIRRMKNEFRFEELERFA